MRRMETSSPLRVEEHLQEASTPRKKLYRVRFASDDESSSEDEGDHSDNTSEADRKLRKEHADEIERYIETERDKITQMLKDFPEDTKLTRKKARELEHDIISMLNLGGIQPEETSSVLEEDYGDEEDDEYEPNDGDDDGSDEYSELSTTCSDIDSQPRTPGSALGQDESLNTSTQFDEDEGVFKVPGEPPKTPGREENISRRTRSKLSYTATPIEAMEVPLPPDFKPEIYDTDLDPDESWQEFLKEFQMPLQSLKEDEEETDPEYIAHTNELGDVDEVEDIPITTDELHGLLDELIGGFDFEYVEDENNQTEGTVVQPTRDPNNPHNVTTSHIQPVAIIHTQPSLSPNYEMVLGADNQIYVLSRPELRRLAPGIFKRSSINAVTSPIIKVDITKDTELLLDEIREHKEAFEDHLVESQFNETHRRRLQIQLMKHVQLLGQCYIQSHGHPKVSLDAPFYLRKLRNLVCRSRKSPAIKSLCWNLRDMYKRCLQWQEELHMDNGATQEYLQWVLNNDNPLHFHPRLMEFIVTSKAFVFSELLPKMTVNVRRSVAMASGEIQLVIMSCVELRKQDPNTPTLSCIAAFVKHYAPWRDPETLRQIFRRDRSKTTIAAKYRDTGQVPEVVPETMTLVSYEEVVEPSQRAKGTLPKNWNKYVFSKERIRRVYTDLVQPRKVDCEPSPEPEQPIPQPSILRATAEKPLVTLDFKGFKAEFNLPETTATILENSQSQRHLDSLIARRLRGSGGPRRVKWSAESTQLLIKKIVGNKNSSRKCKSWEQIRRRRQLTRKFHRLLSNFNHAHTDPNATLDESLISTKLFNYLTEFDTFARLLFLRVNEEAMDNPTTVTGPTAKRAKLDDDAAAQAAASAAKRALETKRKLLKAQRMYENNRLLLQPEPLEVVKERDSLFAWNFMQKVRETYLAEGRPEKVDEFLQILKNVKATDSVPLLFTKVESLFLPDHRELAETFLAFLLPGHAAQIGRFFDHFMVTSMATLVGKLKVYFEKQPSQWKKIMGALNELSAEEGVSMATIKQRFLPLLKGNPLLIDWFLQLFPMERAPEARDDELEELVQTKNELPYEEIPASQILAETGDLGGGCAIKYMQGRIQYGNRYILPADLSFLATSYRLAENGAVVLVGEKKRAEKVVGNRKGKGRAASSNKQEEEVEVEEVVAVGNGRSQSKQPVGCVHGVGPAWDLRLEETEEPTGKEEEPLCDAVTLRAHMNRLNPASGADGSAADEGKTSPKKGGDWKTTSAMTGRGGRKAAATAAAGSPKKAGGSSSPPKKATEGPKRKRPATTGKATTAAEKQKEKERATEEGGKKEAAVVVEWTREEDKILLEAINGQEDKTEEQILDEVVAAIPGRIREDINTRFQFLINVLKKFS